jgi:hypothetical protein
MCGRVQEPPGTDPSDLARADRRFRQEATKLPARGVVVAFLEHQELALGVEMLDAESRMLAGTGAA